METEEAGQLRPRQSQVSHWDGISGRTEVLSSRKLLPGGPGKRWLFVRAETEPQAARAWGRGRGGGKAPVSTEMAPAVLSFS